MLLLRENKPLFMQPILCNKVRKGLLENCEDRNRQKKEKYSIHCSKKLLNKYCTFRYL